MNSSVLADEVHTSHMSAEHATLLVASKVLVTALDVLATCPLGTQVYSAAEQSVASAAAAWRDAAAAYATTPSGRQQLQQLHDKLLDSDPAAAAVADAITRGQRVVTMLTVVTPVDHPDNSHTLPGVVMSAAAAAVSMHS